MTLKPGLGPCLSGPKEESVGPRNPGLVSGGEPSPGEGVGSISNP